MDKLLEERMNSFISQFKNWTRFEKVWIISMTLLLLVSSEMMGDTLLGIITTLTGMLCVVLIAKGNIWNYFWGIINVSLYAFICYQANYAGDFMLNAFFYLPMNVIGLLMWKRHYDNAHDVVDTRKFNVIKWICTIIIIAIATAILSVGMPLINSLLKMDANPLPIVDAFTTVTSITAMLLMVYRYTEQWILWIVVNLLSIVMWLSIGNSAMVIMFTAYEINSIYGYINWRKLNKVQN